MDLTVTFEIRFQERSDTLTATCILRNIKNVIFLTLLLICKLVYLLHIFILYRFIFLTSKILNLLYYIAVFQPFGYVDTFFLCLCSENLELSFFVIHALSFFTIILLKSTFRFFQIDLYIKYYHYHSASQEKQFQLITLETYR